MDSLLVYDSNSAAWINKTLEEMLFVGATEYSAGKIGLVPTPELGKTDLFLRSDGTWSEPIVHHTFLTLDNENNLDHQELIEQSIESIDNTNGDIIIIRDKIIDEKWQYTSYVFDGSVWRAMDGNYNAENVYFDEDLITTSAVGNITLTNGNATIAAAGKNLKQIFNTIFVKEKNPKVNYPSILLTLINDKPYEVGSKVKPSYQVNFNPGKYEFGPNTNVSINHLEVNHLTESLSSMSGSFKEITIEDNNEIVITANVEYSQGSIPLSNLGNDCVNSRIEADTIISAANGYFGYRNTFYGTMTEKIDLTNEVIRNLTPSDKALTNGETVEVSIPIGAKRIIFAYPSDLHDLESVIDSNGFGAEIISSFKKMEIAIEGANGYTAKPYKVYYLDYANPNNQINSYLFTIKGEDIK